jgi:hypothetical protein
VTWPFSITPGKRGPDLTGYAVRTLGKPAKPSKENDAGKGLPSPEKIVLRASELPY